MSGRRQFALLVWVLCSAFASVLFANPARAQCRHGGGLNPGVSPGLLQQSLLQQRQLLQQQQLQLQILQQVQQQQLLQTARLNRQMRELADKGPEALKAALKDPNAELRLIAALAIGKYGPALTDDLIERLTDENASVRQAARRSLVRLSTGLADGKGKPSVGRAVDFGPAPEAKPAAQKTAANKWRTWFERQQTKAANLKAGTAAAPAVLPKIPLLAAEASATRRDAVVSKPGGP